MSGRRSGRRRHRRSGSEATANGETQQPAAATPANEPRRTRQNQATSAPRRSALPIMFALLVGLFIGRVLTTQFGGTAFLGAIDLVMYAGLAAVVAVAFRRWARRNVEERRRQQLRRRRGNATDGADEGASE